MEGDGGLHSVVVLTEWISIHALRVEGDRHPLTRFRDRWHFYPRPPGGGRPRGNFHGLYIEIFLSTPSGWRATRAFHTVTRRSDYFYPRPPGGGRQLDGASKGYGAAISIHALRVEGDGTMMRFFPSTNSHFYPRPPGGGRLVVATGQATVVAFLSTPSGWRATLSTALHGAQRRFLSTPSGWRATIEAVKVPARCRFLSTPSGWRATSPRRWRLWRCENFYPRPPGGGRHKAKAARNGDVRFLSTPSGWRATGKNGDGTEEA